MTCDKPDPRFAYIAPFLKQAKAVAWKYLVAAADPVREVGATLNETETRVDYPNGGQVRLFGADNPDALRGMHFDGVVLDEFADMDPETWTKIIFPALVQRGGWVVFIGTPKGKNEFFRIWEHAKSDPEWFHLMLKASETGLVPDDKLAMALKLNGLDAYEQEFECSFNTSIQGAFYADELRRADTDGRIGRVPIDRALLVHTAWDLGRKDSTAIWFIQCVGRERRLIDYHEASLKGIDYYCQVLKDKGYNYGTHYFPHDIEAQVLGMERTRVDQFTSLGVVPHAVEQCKDVLDGINAVRRMLDATWIDAERCARGLAALREYRREWDEKLKDWKKDPLHDWASHGADALRCFAAGYEEPMPALKPLRRAGGGWMGA